MGTVETIGVVGFTFALFVIIEQYYDAKVAILIAGLVFISSMMMNINKIQGILKQADA